VVQIHSPRPILLEPAIYRHREGRGAPGARPGGRWFKSICSAFFCSSNQCVALRSQLRVLLHVTDNTNNLCDLVWNLEALSATVWSIDLLVGPGTAS
jgi:hypothetical protein